MSFARQFDQSAGRQRTQSRGRQFNDSLYLNLFGGNSGVPGKFGEGFSFSAVSDFGAIGGTPGPDFGKRSFTVRAWFNPSSTVGFLDFQYFCFLYNPITFANGFSLFLNLEVVEIAGIQHQFRVYQWSHSSGGVASDSFFDAGETEPVFPTPGQWHRVVLWYDAAALELGMQVDDRPPVTAATGGATERMQFNMGGTGFGPRGFAGSFDDIGIWHNYVWTEADRLADWNAGAGVTWPDILRRDKVIAYFTFEPPEGQFVAPVFKCASRI